MEFGFEPGLQPASSRFELSRHVEPAQSWLQTGSKPNSITLSWSLTASKLVRSWSLLAGASSLLAS